MDPQKPNENRPSNLQKAKAPVQTFEFITLTDNQKIDGRDRYTVRKQAMKNNTNRRIKGAKNPSEEYDNIESEKQLTGPPVIQQALQSKRFRLLPRGLQDLEDKPKLKPPCPRASSSKSSGMMMQTFELSPVHFPEDMFTVDQTIQSPIQAEWTNPYLDGGGAFDPQSTSRNNSISDIDSLNDLLHSFSALQYQTAHQDSIPASLDPLSCIPESVPYRARLLIQHDFTVRSRATSLMICVRKSWLALSLTDAALFNVVLAHYAANYRLVTGRGDPMEAISFIAASIRIINERMNWPDQRTSDGTIAAVAGMVLQEVKNGDEVAVKAHLSGLERMISLRGGLLKAKFPAALQRMIAWAELYASSVLSTTPTILPHHSPALDIAPYRFTETTSGCFDSSSSQPLFNRNIVWDPIDTDIEQVFLDLHYLSSIVESDDPKVGEEIDNMWYSDKTYLVQRSLVYLYQHPQMSHSKLDTLKCLAASIYVDSCLRGQKFSAPAIGILVSKLKSELESFLMSYDLELVESSEEADQNLLWVCAFGGIAAYGWPDRNWFVEVFTSVCDRLEIEEWEHAKGKLRETLWNKKWEEPKEALWRDIVARRADLAAGVFMDPMDHRRDSDDISQYSP
ncbi:hypothetical protein BKA64DRAFT_673420 [Cadophora sp. MPI-SDFR-AT-0126]|nr:hypothetical protein BKA64DRAFT_673420 [Leotiomycetes sp. MPI-SDFR-AT-0126]